MTDTPPTRRTDEPPTQDGAPLAGWPIEITAEQAAALQTALKQLQTALDAVTRERDEAKQALGDLLAITNRDGGHRTAFAGLGQSVTDAHAAWGATMRELDAARAEVERLRGERDTLLLDARDFVRKHRAEVERLREALTAIQKIPRSDAAFGVIQCFAADALEDGR